MAGAIHFQRHGKYPKKKYLEATNEHQTKWTSYSEFKFSDFMVIISKVLPEILKNVPSSFKKILKLLLKMVIVCKPPKLFILSSNSIIVV